MTTDEMNCLVSQQRQTAHEQGNNQEITCSFNVHVASGELELVVLRKVTVIKVLVQSTKEWLSTSWC